MKNNYNGRERREFLRLDYTAPLAYKVCKKKTISNLLQGYICDISHTGLRCKINQKVRKNDMLWLSFDRATLDICEELEKKVLIYQKGIIGKAVWVKPEGKNMHDVGVQFLTREEKNLTHIYPQIHFLKQGDLLINEEEEPEEEEIEAEGILEEEQPEEEQ